MRRRVPLRQLFDPCSFFMIAFASYVESQSGFKQTFSQWMEDRVEIWKCVFVPVFNIATEPPPAKYSSCASPPGRG